MAKWCNEGKTSVGDVFLKNAAQVSKYLGLYLDATEPPAEATLASITEVTVGNGYARIQLGDADWTEQATKGEFKNLGKTFAAAGGNWGTVYGYFICTSASGTSGKLLEVEHFTGFGTPYAIADGSSLVVTATVKVQAVA